jgi:LmbE family N-acetylglucosaminyl deacetylase
VKTVVIYEASNTVRTYMVIAAHADDAALWCGGLMLRWASEGHRVILVRATSDENDSIGLSREETIAVNKEQLQAAAHVLGVAEVVDLGFRDTLLTDAIRVELRDRLIHLYRQHRPYATCSFDPYSLLYENNQDHLTVAKAADEAFWMAMCDKYVPEDLDAGLPLHGVFERWYFARRLPEVTDWFDIGTYIEHKIDAVLCHEVMLRDMMLQLRLQAATGGYRIPLLEEDANGSLQPFVEWLVRNDAGAAGVRHGCAYAEEYRVIPFAAGSGSMVALLARDAPR